MYSHSHNSPNGNRPTPYEVLMENRVTSIEGQINQALAREVNQELRYFDFDQPGSDVSLYINSGGGEIASGFAIRDTCKSLHGDVNTIGVGMAASMAAYLLICAGTPGKRYATENTEIFQHQPLGGVQGQSADIEIEARHIGQLRKKIEAQISKASGLSLEKVHELCDRNSWLSAQEAKELGLIDHVIVSD